ncbi:ATP-binding protein [Quadrisphaera sp. INWT6]|uniref:ATP-binding protein n=1 Tax=Quadrisphaera sp. INWT6 TaxID=2596917 RepID=UPI0018926832|nr:ATP-binding protein [Quadrisphaera sp. INWT6]
MQDWGAPTGNLPVVRELLGLQTFSPQTVSVRAARRFVQECLTATPMHALADDAGLLVSELAANAVLHARTDFDVAVSALQAGSGVRVTVRDDAASLPMLTAPSATAMSGRGLALVQTLASRWGAGPSSTARKGVWFELDLTSGASAVGASAGDAVGGGAAEMGVEELLAAWGDSEPAPVVSLPVDAPVSAPRGAPRQAPADALLDGEGSAGTAGPVSPGRAGEPDVVLPALDAADLLAAKEGMDDVLRELQLILLAPRPPQDHQGASADADGSTRSIRSISSGAPGLELARRLDAAARGFDGVRRQVRQQVSLAVARGEHTVQLRLDLPPGTYQAALEYRAAVEAAEALADQGTLLSTSARALGRHRAVRRAYLGEVIAAAAP